MAARRRTLPAGALPARLPPTLEPQLASLVDAPPPGDWLYEIKYDGYRLLARVATDRLQLFTRGGHDWTQRFPVIARALREAGLPPGWYDGEIVLPDAQGRPSFAALQAAIDGPGNADIVYYLFDAPYMDGLDLRAVGVQERRALLQAHLAESAHLRFSHALEADVHHLLRSACAMGLEGLIGKRLGSPYVSGRSGHWTKLKCVQRQDFVIGGYTLPEGARPGVGALLVGQFDPAGRLRYAGTVGTGFTERLSVQLRQRLDALARPQSPFAGATGHEGRARWVRPQLACEVSYGEWPADGQLRHAAFKGLRQDTPAPQLVPERALRVAAEPRTPGRSSGRLHAAATPARQAPVIDPATGLTQADLLAFHAAVGIHALPHLRGRPLQVVRAPGGLAGRLRIERQQAPGTPWKIDGVEALLRAAGAGVLELRAGGMDDRPDRVRFILRPGAGCAWQALLESAWLLHTLLHELQLKSWVMTSGGTALHVLVPCRPQREGTAVRAWARAVAAHLARTIPERFAVAGRAGAAPGRVGVDGLCNGADRFAVAPLSPRARAGLGVAMPVAWEDLWTLASADAWDIANAPAAVAGWVGEGPWQGFAGCRQSLGKAVESLGLGG